MNYIDNSDLFPGKRIWVGGVYPFQPDNFPSSSQDTLKIDTDNLKGNLKDLKTYRERIYFSQQRFSSPPESKLYGFSMSLGRITLTTGKTILNPDFQVYISFYESTFATIIFWLSLEKYQFQLNELVEVIALVRGTNERIDPRKEPSIKLERYRCKEVDSFIEVCEFILRKKKIKRVTNRQFSFLYPLLFVGEMPCSSKAEILKKYRQEITALSEVWITDVKKLSAREIARVMNTEFHTHKFGVSVVTAGCMTELHPQLDSNIEQQLNKERLVLSIICEKSVSRFYILRRCDEKISNAHLDILHKFSFKSIKFIFSLILFIYLLVLLKLPLWLSFLTAITVAALLFVFWRTIELIRARKHLISELNLVPSFYVTRKSYIRELFDQYNVFFKLSLLEERIEKKLQHLNENINNIYSILIALLALLIAIVSIPEVNQHHKSLWNMFIVPFLESMFNG